MFKYYFTIFLFIFLSFYLFLILSSFLFHFLHLFSFFAVFLFFCASNESAIRCFICMSLFSVLSLLAFCKSSEKNDKTIQTTKKTQVPFAFVVVLLYALSWTINSDYFSPPSHPYHFKSHPTLSPVPS